MSTKLTLIVAASLWIGIRWGLSQASQHAWEPSLILNDIHLWILVIGTLCLAVATSYLSRGVIESENQLEDGSDFYGEEEGGAFYPSRDGVSAFESGVQVGFGNAVFGEEVGKSLRSSLEERLSFESEVHVASWNDAVDEEVQESFGRHTESLSRNADNSQYWNAFKRYMQPVLAVENLTAFHTTFLLLISVMALSASYLYGCYTGWQTYSNQLQPSFKERVLAGQLPKGISNTESEFMLVNTVDGQPIHPVKVWLSITDLREPIASGQRVQVQALLQSPKGDFGNWLASQGVYSVAKVHDLKPTQPLAIWWQSASYVRKELYDLIAHSDLDRDTAGLFLGLVIGDTSYMSPLLQESFLQAGLTHLVAVSGSNVAFVASIVAGICWVVGVPRKLVIVISMCALTWFAMLVNFDSSVVRAVIMASIVLFALFLGRVPEIVQALGLTVIGCLVFAPYLSVTLGFQLSVFATLAVVWSSIAATKIWKFWLSEQLELLLNYTSLSDISKRSKQAIMAASATALATVSITVSAHVITMPILWMNGLPISPAAPFANLIAVPLASLVSGLVQILSIVTCVWQGGALMVIPILQPVLRSILVVAQVFGSAQAASTTYLLTIGILIALLILALWFVGKQLWLQRLNNNQAATSHKPSHARSTGSKGGRSVEEQDLAQGRNRKLPGDLPSPRNGDFRSNSDDFYNSSDYGTGSDTDLNYGNRSRSDLDYGHGDASVYGSSAHSQSNSHSDYRSRFAEQDESFADYPFNDHFAIDPNNYKSTTSFRAKIMRAIRNFAHPAPPVSKPQKTQRLISRGRFIGLTVGIGIAVALVVRKKAVPHVQPSGATIEVINVDQGDSILLGDPQGGWLLIDTGKDNGLALDYLHSKHIKRLAGILITHDHADHMGALSTLLANFEVKQVLVGYEGSADPGDSTTTPAIEIARRNKVPVVELARGTNFSFGGFNFDVLNPMIEFPKQSPNDASVVLHGITPNGTRVLLTGDAERASQWRLMQEPQTIMCDLLKVPHHGGDTNAKGFIEQTLATHAFISCGKNNDYGHPDPNVLESLTFMEVKRTDLDGNLIYYV